MFRMKFVFVVSLIAMFAFGASFADIASTSYAVAVEQGASGAGKAMVTDSDGKVITGVCKVDLELFTTSFILLDEAASAQGSYSTALELIGYYK